MQSIELVEGRGGVTPTRPHRSRRRRRDKSMRQLSERGHMEWIVHSVRAKKRTFWAIEAAKMHGQAIPGVFTPLCIYKYGTPAR